MKIRCSAVVENDMQLKNLCQCVRMLGGRPIKTSDDTVSVEYEGIKERVDKFASLFENYFHHEISITP